ncbi:hypothetical protein TorRG33x02_356310, partial [Trema orientale]
ESEKGTWHVPVAGDGTEDSEKTWLCITRPSINIPLDEVLQKVETSQNGNDLCCDVKLLRSCTSGSVGSSNTSDGSLDLSETRDKGTIAVTGKRKERSSSTF